MTGNPQMLYTPAQKHTAMYYFGQGLTATAGMLCNVTCHHDHITNHRTQPSSPDFMFCLCTLPADAFLSDHPQNVIGQDCQFQYQLIGLKFAGWQPLHIHIGLDLAMELLVYDTLELPKKSVRIP